MGKTPYVYNIVRRIYFDHKQRGEEIEEINLSPSFFYAFKGSELVNMPDKKTVRVCCRGWVKIGSTEYLEIQSVYGMLRVHGYTVSIK